MFRTLVSFLKTSRGSSFYFIFLAALIVLSSNPSRLTPKAKAQSEIQACATCSESKDRVIYAPTIGVAEAGGSDIVLNYRSPHEMDVTPTFYTADGAALVGETLHLQPSEMRFVKTESLIPEAERGQHIWGGISFAYRTCLQFIGKLFLLW